MASTKTEPGVDSSCISRNVDSKDAYMHSRKENIAADGRVSSPVVKEESGSSSITLSASPAETIPHPSAKGTFRTPEELDYAKDLVLDLLGWGVHPEYLIECGVSSQTIYRIFTDLRLRLPTNIVL